MPIIKEKSQPDVVKKTKFSETRQLFQNVAIRVTKRAIQSFNFVSGTIGWKINADGTAEFQDVNIGHRRIAVKPGSSIQDAVDLVNAAGGGVVFLKNGTHTLSSDIDLKSNVTLEGEGIYQTILDFNDNANSLNIKGTIITTAGTITIDTGVDDTIVTGSAGADFSSVTTSHLIWLGNDWYEIASVDSTTQLTLAKSYPEDYSNTTYIADIIDSVTIKNLTVKNSTFTTSGSGEHAVVSMQEGRRLTIDNVIVSDADNTLYSTNGIFMDGISHCRFRDVQLLDNLGSGIRGFSSFVTFEKCKFKNNNEYAMFLDTIVGEDNFVINCYFENLNGGIQADYSQNIKILGNTFKFCSVNYGILLANGNNIIVSNNRFLSSAIQINSNNYTTITSNDLYNSDVGLASERCIFTDNNLKGCTFSNSGVRSVIQNNVSDSESGYSNEIINHNVSSKKNTSGGSLSSGQIVILKSVASGLEVTTTTTQGDDKVYGVVGETIANNDRGFIVTEGKITTLKVNGATAIAIGDFIGTYTSAGIGMKASVGDMAIAIALEAYAVADSNGVIDALIIKPVKI